MFYKSRQFFHRSKFILALFQISDQTELNVETIKSFMPNDRTKNTNEKKLIDKKDNKQAKIIKMGELQKRHIHLEYKMKICAIIYF